MLAAFGLTDVGRKRRHNEDAYLLDVERGLFVVADGMGGHAAGEVASRITVESIQEFIAGTEEEHENTWPFGFNNRYSLEGNRLTTAVEKANEKVMRAVQNRPELKGMGTTVVAALFDPDRATLVHVGDSRAYLYRSGELKRLTDDHSWVQEQVNAGILSEDEAKSHPLKNVVTRALGGAAHVAVDLIEVPIHTGDRFLLCSDGLTGMVTDDEIVSHLSSPDSLDKPVRALVELANEHGGVDNITAIVVEVRSGGVDRKTTEPMLARPVDAGDSTAVSVRSVVPTEAVHGAGSMPTKPLLAPPVDPLQEKTDVTILDPVLSASAASAGQAAVAAAAPKPSNPASPSAAPPSAPAPPLVPATASTPSAPSVPPSPQLVGASTPAAPAPASPAATAPTAPQPAPPPPAPAAEPVATSEPKEPPKV